MRFWCLFVSKKIQTMLWHHKAQLIALIAQVDVNQCTPAVRSHSIIWGLFVTNQTSIWNLEFWSLIKNIKENIPLQVKKYSSFERPKQCNHNHTSTSKQFGGYIIRQCMTLKLGTASTNIFTKFDVD